MNVEACEDGWLVITEESETYSAAVLLDGECLGKGINGGRIYKLHIRNKRNNLWMADYTSGVWNVVPAEEARAFYEEILKRYN